MLDPSSQSQSSDQEESDLNARSKEERQNLVERVRLRRLVRKSQPRKPFNFQAIPQGSPLEYALVIIGTLLIGVGNFFFKFPNQFVFGGVTGLSTVISSFTPNFSASQMTAVINMILLLLGFVILGKEFGAKTTLSTILLSAFLALMDRFVPISEPLTDQKFLELCFAIFLPAAGSAILFNVGASSGGTDVIAMILKKFGNTGIGTSLFLSDFFITFSSFFVFDISTALMSTFGLFAKSVMVDSVIESLNLSKYFTIITSHPEEVRDIITKDMKRSGTRLVGEGLYTGKERTVIFCVVSRAQAVFLRDEIRRCDPTAFIMITNTSQIVGKGFRGMF